MGNDGKGAPFVMLAAVGLMGMCCVGPLLLAGGGGAVISGFFGDNLWAIIGGLAVLVLGLLLMKGRGTEEEDR